MRMFSYQRQTTLQRIEHGDPYMTSAPFSIHIDGQTGTCSTLKSPGSKLHPFISINFPSSTNLFRFPSYILIHCFSCTGAPLICGSSPRRCISVLHLNRTDISKGNAQRGKCKPLLSLSHTVDAIFHQPTINGGNVHKV